MWPITATALPTPLVSNLPITDPPCIGAVLREGVVRRSWAMRRTSIRLTCTSGWKVEPWSNFKPTKRARPTCQEVLRSELVRVSSTPPWRRRGPVQSCSSPMRWSTVGWSNRVTTCGPWTPCAPPAFASDAGDMKSRVSINIGFALPSTTSIPLRCHGLNAPIADFRPPCRSSMHPKTTDTNDPRTGAWLTGCF